MTSPRRTWIAALLSLLLPGLGHLYVGRPGPAAAASLLSVAAVALMYLCALFIPLAPWNIALSFLLIPTVWLGVPLHAALLARRAGTDFVLKPYNRWYVYVGLYLLLGVLLLPEIPTLVRAHVVEAFRIPSGSMEPTTRIGDLLYIAKWPASERRPAHDRVVVFDSVDEPGLKVMKRVLGMPGDTLLMRSGALIRNGRPLEESYVVHTDRGRGEDAIQRAKMQQWQAHHLVGAGTRYRPDLQDWGPIVVPPDSFFALGDNRDASYDSRYYGFVPFVNVIGRPAVIYFSFEPTSADPLLSRVRWERIGQRIN
jgi:signal peptidase I